MECNFCEQIIPWHELKNHQCQAKEGRTLQFQDVPIGGTFRWTENGAVMRKTGRTTYNYLERDGKNLSTHPLRTLYSPPYSVGSETDRPIFEIVS